MSSLSAAESVCISELQVDRYFAGELTDIQRAAFEQHVQRCELCTARRDALATERAAYLARMPRWDALHAARAPVPSRRMPWPWLSATTVALAAAALLMLVPGQHQPEQGVRSRGRPSISLYVKRAGRVARASSGDTFLAGDLLRVTYSSQHPVYFALLQRDAEGVAVQYPVQADKTALVQAGRDLALDFSIQLDATEGEEQLLALFCDRPTELRAVRTSLQRARTLPTVMHCQLDELVLNKRAAPP
jgi:hypothetical protein